MQLTDWLSFLRPPFRYRRPRKTRRRRQHQRVARNQYADSLEQRIALGEIFSLHQLVTGTFLAGSEPVTVDFRPAGGRLQVDDAQETQLMPADEVGISLRPQPTPPNPLGEGDRTGKDNTESVGSSSAPWSLAEADRAVSQSTGVFDTLDDDLFSADPFAASGRFGPLLLDLPTLSPPLNAAEPAGSRAAPPPPPGGLSGGGSGPTDQSQPSPVGDLPVVNAFSGSVQESPASGQGAEGPHGGSNAATPANSPGSGQSEGNPQGTTQPDATNNSHGNSNHSDEAAGESGPGRSEQSNRSGGNSSSLPVHVDRNRDGLADASQADVYILPMGERGETVVLDAHGRELEGLRNRPGRGRPSEDVILPYGTFEFTVEVDEPGGSATIDLYLPEGAEPDAYFKQDPNTGQFYEFDYDGTTGAEINGSRVTLHLVDGGRGDGDGLANGVIVDPGGPGMTGVVTVPCPGPNGLDGWTITETGSGSDPGSVVVEDGHLVMREGDSFLVSLEREVTIPVDASILTFEYEAVFDTTDQDFINDAFEAALLDTAGNPVVPPFRVGNDSFFNWTEEEPAALGSLTTHFPDADGDSGTVDVDISGLTAGSTARLVFRLVNDDSDVNTTVRITCSQAPVAVDDAYSVNEDATLTEAAAGVLANDTDADGDPLTAVLADDVTHGSLSLGSDGSFTYTPDADFSGSDSFTYFAFDGSVESEQPATVTITVNPINDPPVASDDSYTIKEDTALSGNVLSNDSDADGDPLAATKLSDPANGTLVFNPNGSFSYTPNADFHGTDSFTYRVYDGTVDSNTATVTITVTPVNDPPVAADDAYSVDEDTVLAVNAASGVLVNDVDVDGDAIDAVLVDDPSHGTLSLGSDGSFSYTPDANYFGADNFTYKVRDTLSESNVATVTLTVNPINDPPQVADDEYSVKEDTTLTVPAEAGVLINDSDVEGDPLGAFVVTGPSNGQVSLAADGSLTYTPNLNFNGTDSFTYRANDGTDDSPTTATVTIHVSAVNDPPVANSDNYSVDEDTTLTVNAASGVLANDSDVDGDPLSAMLFSGPSHGSLSLSPDGSLTYTPDADYHGSDSFLYRADDGTAKSLPTLVTITVNPINDAPVAVDDSYTIDEDTPLSINAPGLLTNDSDIDGDALSAVWVNDPANGTLALGSDGSFTYTPDANFFGTDSFTYRGSDSLLTSNLATVTITVNPVNDAPVVSVTSLSGNEGASVNLSASFTDIEPGDTHTALIHWGDGTTSAGVVTESGGSGTITGSHIYADNGNYTVTVEVTDDGSPALTGDGTATARQRQPFPM